MSVVGGKYRLPEPVLAVPCNRTLALASLNPTVVAPLSMAGIRVRTAEASFTYRSDGFLPTLNVSPAMVNPGGMGLLTMVNVLAATLAPKNDFLITGTR